jgi:ABC-type Zn uptake system ZnuABC Zn-binding protein ZnuA
VETLKGIGDKNRVLLLYVSTNPKGKEIALKLSQMTGIKAVGLDPLVGYTDGDYISVMEENLKKILGAVKH